MDTPKIGYEVKGPPSNVIIDNFPDVMERANLRSGRAVGESIAKKVIKEVNKKIAEQRREEQRALENQETPAQLTDLTQFSGRIGWWRMGDHIAFGVKPKGTEGMEPEELAKELQRRAGEPSPLLTGPQRRAKRELRFIVRSEYLLNRKLKRIYVNNVWQVINEQLRRVTPVLVPRKPKRLGGLIRRIIKRLFGV